mgnify:CR=1 FL=1
MDIVRKVHAMKELAARARAEGRRIGFVPTMGYLHEGHMSLVRRVKAECDLAVWWGNYYALETIRRLGLDDEAGAVRAGFVHYNTEDEVDRLLAGVAGLL